MCHKKSVCGVEGSIFKQTNGPVDQEILEVYVKTL